MCQSVSVSVCQCITLRTRRHVTRRLVAGGLGTSNSKLFRRPLLLPSCCCGCVLNCSCFLCVWKFWRVFHRKLALFVQGKLYSISKLLCRAVYDLSFISKINCTALPCLFFVISFRCCLIVLVFSADWTEAKTLLQAHIHGFEFRCVYMLQVCHEYSRVSHKLSQASIYCLELSV